MKSLLGWSPFYCTVLTAEDQEAVAATHSLLVRASQRGSAAGAPPDSTTLRTLEEEAEFSVLQRGAVNCVAFAQPVPEQPESLRFFVHPETGERLEAVVNQSSLSDVIPTMEALVRVLNRTQAMPVGDPCSDGSRHWIYRGCLLWAAAGIDGARVRSLYSAGEAEAVMTLDNAEAKGQRRPGESVEVRDPVGSISGTVLPGPTGNPRSTPDGLVARYIEGLRFTETRPAGPWFRFNMTFEGVFIFMPVGFTGSRWVSARQDTWTDAVVDFSPSQTSRESMAGAFLSGFFGSGAPVDRGTDISVILPDGVVRLWVREPYPNLATFAQGFVLDVPAARGHILCEGRIVT